MNNLSPEKLKSLKDALVLAEKAKELAPYNKIYSVFPDTGPYARDKYKKHMEVFSNGKWFPQRAIMGGNQVGKSWSGAVEWTYHMTGQYPDWWVGRRFDRPVRFAVYAVTNTQLRDASGYALCGPIDNYGTGFIPRECFAKPPTRVGGSGGFIDFISIEHRNSSGIVDGISECHFYTHKQGREAIQGPKYDGIWFDEEPPESIYNEAIIRTVAVGKKEDGSDAGIIILTFTPLNGLSEVALKFLPNGCIPEVFKNTFVSQITWDDVPHITEYAKKLMLEEMSPMEIDARTKGIPVAGSGMVFPVSNETISVNPFDVPDHWPRVYGFDYSKKRSCAVFAAIDPLSSVVYIYDIFVSTSFDFIQLSNAIRIRGGDWMFGLAETKNSSYDSDYTYFEIFKKEYGLKLQPAQQKAGHKSASLAKMYNMLSTGRLRVFSTLAAWFAEKNIYHYEEKGDEDGKPKVHKHFDDLMDATRYIIDGGLMFARVNPDWVDEDEEPEVYRNENRNPITGY